MRKKDYNDTHVFVLGDWVEPVALTTSRGFAHLQRKMIEFDFKYLEIKPGRGV